MVYNNPLVEIPASQYSEAESIELFKNPHAKRLNRVGVWVLEPLHFFADHFQKGVRMWHEKKRFKAFFYMSSCLVSSIPCYIPAIVGISFKAIGTIYRNDYAFSPASINGFKPQVLENSLKVMTWNIALAPNVMSTTNGLRKAKKRVKSIAELVVKQDATIVAMQEVFDYKATKKLVQELNRKGFDCIHSTLTKGPVQLPSGLFLAIRRTDGVELTIDELKIWKFQNGEAIDGWSNKGLLGLKLKLIQEGQEKFIHIFNTHLQASYEKSGYSHVRQEQLEGICQTIRNWTDDSENVLLCGDMNFSFKKLEPSDSEGEYAHQKLTLETHGFINDHEEAQDNKNRGTFIKVADKIRTSSVVDYIFRGKGFKPCSFPKIVPMEDLHKLASDHCPIVHEVSF